MINSLRKVFEWQHNPLPGASGSSKQIDGFSLMFTTRIGPDNISLEYRKMLQETLEVNIAKDTTLQPILASRAGTADVSVLQANNFDLFFKLATPKVIANALLEADWYIDADYGIRIYEFERGTGRKKYKMLHLVKWM